MINLNCTFLSIYVQGIILGEIMVIYEGLFFDEEGASIINSLDQEQGPIIINEVHCTFKFKPQKGEIFNEIVGNIYEVSLIGYGCDGQNSGFKVKLPSELEKFYINYENNSNALRVPHITASLNYGAIPEKTKDLNFKHLEKEIKIKGRFGYWVKDGGKGHISFEKINF